MSKNRWKQFKIFVCDTYLNNLFFAHKYGLWANEWWSFILWYHTRCLLHSWPHTVTLWATIATHFSAKIAKNGFKKSMFLTMLTSITSYSIHKYVLWANKWCSNILWYHTRCLLHSWPDIVTHCHSHSFVSINGQKWLKNMFCWC
jgi:hypothetical protein